MQSVSPDGRVLVVQGLGGGCGHDPIATVTETALTVGIRVLQLVPADMSAIRCAGNARIDVLRVRLSAPIAGRALIRQSLGTATVGLSGRPTVPRMLGLRTADARFALRAQGFRVRGSLGGVVRGQHPGPQAPVRAGPGHRDAPGAVSPTRSALTHSKLAMPLPTHRPLELDGGPAMSIVLPRPSSAPRGRRRLTIAAGGVAALGSLAAPPAPAMVPPLRPVPFRTIAIGDGAASGLQQRTALVVKGERRWRTAWRSLGTGHQPSPEPPRIDFSRHMLLVASQGRKPSGGHRLRITGVGDPGGRLVVDVTEVSPGKGCISTGVITSPYHVVRVPRSDKPVRFFRHHKEKTCG